MEPSSSERPRVRSARNVSSSPPADTRRHIDHRQPLSFQPPSTSSTLKTTPTRPRSRQGTSSSWAAARRDASWRKSSLWPGAAFPLRADALHGSRVESRDATPSVRAPEMPPPPPFVADAPESVALSDLGTVIFTSGFRPDYASWVRFPRAFDEGGFPIQQDGSSTVVPGLHFMGVHFQRKRKSATFLGAGEDATVLAETLSAA